MRAETPFHLHEEIRHDFQQNIRRNMVAHLSDLIDGFLRASPFVFKQIRCGAVAFRVPVLIVSGVLCFDISTVFCGVEQFLHFLESVCKLALDLLLCKGAIAVEAVPIDIVLGSFFVNGCSLLLTSKCAVIVLRVVSAMLAGATVVSC